MSVKLTENEVLKLQNITMALQLAQAKCEKDGQTVLAQIQARLGKDINIMEYTLDLQSGELRKPDESVRDDD